MWQFFLGVVSGIFANQIYDWIKKARKIKGPRYVCRLSEVNAGEYIEPEFRTKTSPSDYGIELYNLSDETVIIDSFDIFNKRAPIVCTCEIPDDQKRLDPKQKLQYTLMEQDADSLIWHCKKDRFDRCIVYFNRVDGKIIKAELDVSAIVLQIELSASIMTDAYDRNPGSENETL